MGFRRSTGWLVLAAALAGSTCIFPTESDQSVHVTVAPMRILIRGSETNASASAWQLLASGDSQSIPNASFVWSSSNPVVASIDVNGHIIGVKPGTALITAAPANFDQLAKAGTRTLRVAAPLEIDSVRGPNPGAPKRVKYGDTLTVYGVGVDSIILASIAGVDLIPHPYSDFRDASGYARKRFWVPAPATDGQLFYIGNGVFGSAVDTTHVTRQDIYDPNQTTPQPNTEPSRQNLNNPGPISQLPKFLFLNPALAFEVLPRGDTIGVEWYRFNKSDTTQELTFILSTPKSANLSSTFLTDSVSYNATSKSYALGPSAWTSGPGA